MLKKVSIFFVNLFIIIALYSITNFAYPFKKSKMQQENQAPVVKIVSPKNNDVYELNSPLHFEIIVSDKEDGESKFQEISSDEVFLQVKYLPEGSKVSQSVENEAPGLAGIKTSNCLNCHSFSAKLIGPSFYEISKRYPSKEANIDLLIKRIREGSTGVWGDVTMPTHPELTKDQTREIIKWILENGTKSDVNYYRGTAGSFQIKPPAPSKQKGVYVLTASYTDHGLKDKSKQNLRGQDVIIIRGK